MLRVLDLFSGIGGFSLGLARAGGFRTVAFCEIEPYCRAVLEKHWPDVDCYEDVRTCDLSSDVDVITGGFPCQPYSTASHGRITAECFWPAMLGQIALRMPRYVIAENVSERAIERAKDDVEGLGYVGIIKRIGAHEVGGDHQRNRWWLCAHTDDESELRSAVDAEVARLPELCRGLWGPENYARAIRVPDGLPHRMDRFKCLGNAAMPVIVGAFGRAILATPSGMNISPGRR